MQKPIAGRLRPKLAVAALSAASLLLGAHAASASTGCDAVNSGVFSLVVGTTSTVSASQAGFAAGDTLNITINYTGHMHYNLTVNGGGSVDSQTFNSAGTTPATYVLTSAQLDLNLQLITDVVDPSATGSTVATCIPSASPGAPTNDSAMARAVQIAGSKAAAQASGYAITSSASGAVAQLLSSGNVIPGGGPAGFAPPSNLGAAALAPPNALGGPIERSNVGAHARSHAPEPIARGPWRGWADLRGTDIREDDDALAGPRGDHTNFTFGFGRRLDSRSGVGLLGGYERFSYDFTGVGRLRGDGGTVGTYAGMWLMPRLMVDAVAAYSRLEYDASAGTASGSFDADRWLGSIGLTGTFEVHGPVLLAEPSVRIYMLRENQEGWVDSLGTAQASRSFTEGRVSIGGKLVARMPTPRGLLSPYVGLYGEYDFSSDDALPSGVLGLGLNEGWSMRAVTGLNLTMPDGIVLSLGGDFGGIGSDVLTRSLRLGIAAPL